jgi:hypothetical protein
MGVYPVSPFVGGILDISPLITTSASSPVIGSFSFFFL